MKVFIVEWRRRKIKLVYGFLGGCWNRGMARNMKDFLGRYLVLWVNVKFII